MSAPSTLPSAVPEPASLDASETPFFPDCDQVLQVRSILQDSVRSISAPDGLPVELVDIIIDTAEYWPSVEASLAQPTTVRQDGDRECLRTLPLCYKNVAGFTSPQLQAHRGIHPCRKVDFSIHAKDQGWGGGPGARGTYNNAWSWFDAFIIPNPDYALPGTEDSSRNAKKEEGKHEERHSENEGDEPAADPGADDNNDENEVDETTVEEEQDEAIRFGMKNYQQPGPGCLQRNRVAMRQPTTHKFSWDYRDSMDPSSEEAEEFMNSHGRGRETLDGKAVREMSVGDEISIWPRARYPGWTNEVRSLSVRVFWAI